MRDGPGEHRFMKGSGRQPLGPPGVMVLPVEHWDAGGVPLPQRIEGV